ncbi:hypothetical protein [uncultured Cohaesibacter sp.]|uniref:hypothetical protein n=1 Tax=uncultured Cohaesibacter sp. TaxID=1002546 RepID=UPI0029C7DA39|nr:hypothetical protein [uncultured Cohaesibacter sp.]
MTETGTIAHTARTHNAPNPLDAPPIASTGHTTEDFKAELDAQCPFTALGFSGQNYHLLNAAGELVSLTPSHLEKQSTQAALVHGDISWFKTRFPPRDHRQDFDRLEALNWIMMECSIKGYFDPAQHKLRKTGIWRVGSGEDSRLLAHLGSHIYFEGREMDPGFQKEGAFYLISNAIPRMSEPKDAASVGDCKEILDVVNTWTFKDGARGPNLWLGWMMAAQYGGAPEWRVHMMAGAENGAGKSTLAQLLEGLLGGLGQFINEATEAGIRQSAAGRSGAIIYDEVEGKEEGGSVARIVELIRRMSGGAGAVTLRGSAGGKSSTFVVLGVAYLTAILPPMLEPQDRSRFVEIHLGPLIKGEEGMANEEKVNRMLARTDKLSPRLRRRAFDNWDRFNDSIAAYRASFAKLEIRARDALRFATVLAGRDVALYDDMLDGDYYDEEATLYKPLIDQTLSDGSDGEGIQCLNQILMMPLSMLRINNTLSLGEMIAMALNGDELHAKSLSRMGIRVIPEYEQSDIPPGMLVANSHPRLEEIFSGTKWAHKQWQQALRYIDGAHALGRVKKFAGTPARSTYIPLNCLPEPQKSDNSTVP